MATLTTTELKKAILAAQSPMCRPDRAQRATLQKSRRASEKMMTGVLQDAGLNLKKFKTLHDQQVKQLDRVVAAHKSAALKLASNRKATLEARIAAQSKALNAAAAGNVFLHPSFTLDTPLLIWTIPLANIADSAAVPFASWAKFDFKTSATLDQKLGFYFYWENPYNDYAVITATTIMSLTGHLRSHAPWGFGVNSSSVEAIAVLNLWTGWPTAVTSTNSAAQSLGSCGALSNTVYGPDTEATSIGANPTLTATMFPVPPHNVVVFEVALLLECDNDSGNIDADFASGDFQITCPLVVISILNSPRGGLA